MYGVTGNRMEQNGYPAVFNIEADPREEVNIMPPRLGDRPVSESHRRVSEVAGEVSQSQGDQYDGVWQVIRTSD